MKIKYAIAASLMLSISAFAQKDELKALRKISDKNGPPTQEEIKEFNNLLTQVEPKMANADNQQKAAYHYYKGEYAFVQMMMNPALAQVSLKKAIENFDKTIEFEKDERKKQYTKEIQEEIYPELKTQLINAATALNQQQKFKEAAPLFEMAYNMDKTDYATLFNTAATATNAQDYDKALEYYLALDKSGFTGEGTLYTALNKETNVVESFPNPETRTIALQTGKYITPKDEKLPSLKGDIVKNIALIYVHKGEIDKAKQAMTKARKENPEDINLIVEEANLYYKTKDMDTYKRLIQEAIQKNPKEVTLYFNLGVVTSENNKEEAKKYYEKALEIDPNYVNALINLGMLKLEGEKEIVEEMNSLGTSAKENQRYDALKKEREALYNSALPHLQKAHKLNPDDQYVISVLAGMYQALDKQAEYKAMKAKMKE